MQSVSLFLLGNSASASETRWLMSLNSTAGSLARELASRATDFARVICIIWIGLTKVLLSARRSIVTVSPGVTLIVSATLTCWPDSPSQDKTSSFDLFSASDHPDSMMTVGHFGSSRIATIARSLFVLAFVPKWEIFSRGNLAADVE